MADRGATQAFKDEVALAKNRPFHLVRIVFDSFTIHMTDSVRELAWDDGDGEEDWISTGQLLGFSDIEETSIPQVTALTLSLTGVERSQIATFLTYDYIDRPVTIWRGFLNSAGAIIADPVLIFQGRMDQPRISEDPERGTCILSVQVASQWVDFERKPGRHTNHEEQQVWFPGDLGFEYVSGLMDKPIKWGTGYRRIPPTGGGGWDPF